ncbi:MAG: helix-turn-helix transcriptional regulator [Gammaproteobacteria bacterium]|nr:helix-turn-helix transcriptional regulator [Gammaproteobacteria bacterium]
MHDVILTLIEEIVEAGKRQGLDQKMIAEKAGVGESMLSKAKQADDIRFSTLVRLANAVGLRLTLTPNDPTLQGLMSRSLFDGKPDTGE